MGLTNEEEITYYRSPVGIEGAIDILLRHIRTVEDPFNLPESMLIGVSFREELNLSYLGSAHDPCDLLSESMRLEASIYDAVALVTCGWAAPCNPTDDISELIPASQSPDRSRARVILIAGEEGVCVIVRFANNPVNAIIDEGALGPLSEDLLDFWT